MLVPLTRETFEQTIPLIATGPQYAFYWGKPRDFLRRLLISVVGVVIAWLFKLVAGEGSWGFVLVCYVICGLYWLWSPVYWASLRNNKYRQIPYSGFLRGRIIDVFFTEEIVSREQTVNKQGELVIIENKERRINLEIADKSGFNTIVQAPVQRIHKVLAPGQVAELVVLSRQPDLSNIIQVTDAYIPSHNLWVGIYPYLRRDVFRDVSRRISDQYAPRRRN